MDFFDTHIHLQDFADTNVINLLKEGQISKCICVSAKQTDWQKVADIYEKYPDTIVPAFGLHPWYVHEKTSDWAEQLETYLQKYPLSLIGECGFDRLKNKDFDIQKDVFLSQINLAKKYNRTLLVHAVKADIWLKEFWDILPHKTVFHSFNAHLEQLKPIIQNDFYVALNIKVLQNKDGAEIIRQIPKNRMLFETDAPYQSNVADLQKLLQKIASILNENLEELSSRLYANATEIIKNDNEI